MKKYTRPYSMSIIDFEKPSEYGIIPAVAAAIAPLAAAVGSVASTAGSAALAAAGASVAGGAALGLAHKGLSSSGRKNVFNNPLDSLSPIRNV